MGPVANSGGGNSPLARLNQQNSERGLTLQTAIGGIGNEREVTPSREMYRPCAKSDAGFESFDPHPRIDAICANTYAARATNSAIYASEEAMPACQRYGVLMREKLGLHTRT